MRKTGVKNNGHKQINACNHLVEELRKLRKQYVLLVKDEHTTGNDFSVQKQELHDKILSVRKQVENLFEMSLQTQ